MDTRIKQRLEELSPDPTWLDRYLEFVNDAVSPNLPPSMGRNHYHHILPRAMFPEFINLKQHPWNGKALSPADHLLAHYLLYRALPTHPITYLSFLKMASHERYRRLVADSYSPEVLREISEAFARICMGIDSVNGWVHIYRGKDTRTIVPADQVEKYKAKGWTTEAPPRQWVVKDNKSFRVPLEEVPAYLEQGFQLGRNNYYTEKMRGIQRVNSLTQHERERLKPDAYSYLPHGEEHHFKGGVPQEVRDKISKTLTGVPKPLDHPVHQGIAKGKHWKWPEESKQALKDSGIRAGENSPWFGTSGPMGGKTHTEETKDRMSESHKEFYANNPEGVAALDAARPRGDGHWTYGKERPQETRDKISQSLTGIKQSKETKQKRAASLALAKMPSYTEDEVGVFCAILRATTAKERKLLARPLKGTAKICAAGLRLIADGLAVQDNRRYWRQADAWRKSNKTGNPSI